MKALIGLGNPGVKYERSKHNVGFMLLDMIAHEFNLPFRSGFKGMTADGKIGAEKVLFLKPLTYMNLSGFAVAQLTDYYKLSPQDILVIHDDMDLPLGRIRLRSKGSSGGHNGLKSIISELGTQDFWRLKIGVGRPEEGREVVTHVLSGFKDEENRVLEDVLERGYKASLLWLEGKEDEAMNTFNRD